MLMQRFNTLSDKNNDIRGCSYVAFYCPTSFREMLSRHLTHLSKTRTICQEHWGTFPEQTLPYKNINWTKAPPDSAPCHSKGGYPTTFSCCCGVEHLFLDIQDRNLLCVWLFIQWRSVESDWMKCSCPQRSRLSCLYMDLELINISLSSYWAACYANQHYVKHFAISYFLLFLYNSGWYIFFFFLYKLFIAVSLKYSSHLVRTIVVNADHLMLPSEGPLQVNTCNQERFRRPLFKSQVNGSRSDFR